MAEAFRLALVCDSGPGIGSGHLVRQLCVATAWVRSIGPVSLTTPGQPADWLRSAYLDAGVELAEQVPMSSAVCLVDSYRVDNDELRQLRERSLLVLTDDFHQLATHPCDVLLDHNPGATAATYPHREPDTHLLLGASYTMVRPEFVVERKRRSEIRPSSSPSEMHGAPRVVVTLGGDPTPGALSELEAEIHKRIPDVEVLVADGTVSDMATFLGQADLAVSASGSTIYELCVLGIPSVVVPIVENQRSLAATLDELGAAVESTLSGAAEQVAELAQDQDRQIELGERAASLIDGGGAQRIVAELHQLLEDSAGGHCDERESLGCQP